jgi:hypothetical protein
MAAMPQKSRRKAQNSKPGAHCGGAPKENQKAKGKMQRFFASLRMTAPASAGRRLR